MVNWGAPSSLTVNGCSGGDGLAVVTSTDTQNGTLAADVGPLTESPADSGTYSTTIPPQYPSHGAASVYPLISCSTPSALVPGSGPSEGGNIVQIFGQGFTGATVVDFGTSPAPSFRVVSDTEIDAVAPPGTGTASITVTLPSGTVGPSSLASYVYTSLTSLSPASGPAAGGTAVTITGSGLSNVAAVYFGDVAATSVTVVSDTEVQVASPPGAGDVPVSVLSTDGGASAGDGPLFSYSSAANSTQQAARAESLTSSAQGSLLEASKGLPHRDDEISSQLGGARPTSNAVSEAEGGAFDAVSEGYHWYSDGSEILQHVGDECGRMPLGAAFLTEITHYVTNIAKDAATSALTWTYMKAFFPDTLSEITEELLPQLERALSWEALVGAAAEAPFIAGAVVALAVLGGVYYLTTQANATTNAVSNIYNCAMLAVPAGVSLNKNFFDLYIDPSGTVQDTNGNPLSGASVTLQQSSSVEGPFSSVPAGSTVMIPSVNPETTAADGQFDWEVLAGYYEIEAAKSGCTAPGNASQPTVSTGPLTVPPPQVGLTLTLSCSSEPPPPTPAVTALSVQSGPASGGTQIVIDGSGFGSSSTVKFGSTAATSVVVLSPGSLDATAPAGTGTADVTVTSNGATSATSAADRFTYVVAPTVKKVSPASGSPVGGTTVTIKGKGFDLTDGVLFGTQPAGEVTFVSSTKLMATAPPEVGPSPVDIQVVGSGGTSTVVTGDQFSYAAIRGGTVVIANNQKLIGNLAVNVSGTGWSVHGDTQLTMYECSGSYFSSSTCDIADGNVVTLKSSSGGSFTNAEIDAKSRYVQR